jgi:hypothetical protein
MKSIVNARNGDSSVSIATGYRLDDWGLNPDSGKIFLFWGPPAYPMGTGLKRPGSEADH